MERLIKCKDDELVILNAALSSYLNYYKDRLKNCTDNEYKPLIEQRIRYTEGMLKDLEF